MTRYASAFAWLLWRRHRWPFTALLLYGTVVAVATQLSDSSSFTTRMMFFTAALPLFFGLLYLLAAFSFPDADLAARQSGFPPHLLVLPARTATLVLWPLLGGTVTMALGWMAFARLVLTPNGMQVPADWPAVMLAALLACLQALSWSPVGLPYLRLLLALLLLPALAALGVVGALNGVTPTVLSAAYGGVILLAGAASVAGLARARRGETPEWHWLPRRFRQAETAVRRSVPFASPAQAQLWFEWRRNGITLPLLMAGFCFMLTVPLVWFRDLVPLGAGGAFAVPALRELELNLWVKLQQACLFWPVILATIVGCGMRKSDTRRKDLSLHPFPATRPMTSAALVLAKLRMALLSTLAAWGVLLLFLWGWLLTPARDGERAGSLAALILRHWTLETGLLALLSLAGLILWTWRNQVVGLGVDLTGRPWIVHGLPTAITALCLFGLVTFVQWTSGRPDTDPQRVGVPSFLPWLVGTAVALKAAGAVWALRALVRRRLMEARAVALLGGAWLLLVLALFGLLSWLVEARFFASAPLPSGLLAPAYLAAAAVLFLPLTRLALAPLALAWNRHR